MAGWELSRHRLAATIEAFRYPPLCVVQIGHRKGTYLARDENGKNAQCGSEPALITDDTDALVCGGVAGCELQLLLCRVSLVFAEPRPEEVQQANFVAVSDLLE